MNQLEPCPHCDRHVKVSETSCPFCKQSLGDAFANIARRLASRVRLGRAATFAFGLVAMSQGACDDADSRPDAAASVPADASPDAMHDAGVPPDADLYDGGGIPIYSAAPTFDSRTPATSPEPMPEPLIEPNPHDTADLRRT